MRNLSCSVLGLVLAALALVTLGACGPSGKQVATAKQARYQGDPQQLFAVIKQTVESKYKILKSDEAALGLQTEGRWYNPEGQAISATIGDARDVPDQSLNISLVVELLADGDRRVVSVKPLIMRYHQGRPNPDTVEPTDPSLPGWVHGKGDNLLVAIHEALQPYEVKAAGGAAPAPDPAAPGPAPAADSADPAAPSPDPAAGSAAPAPAP